MTQLGRIGGGVLADDLVRQGADLSFKNQSNSVPVLFLDVNTKQIGFNTDILVPDRDLTVPAKIRTDNLINNIFQVPNYTMKNNLVEVFSGNIFLNSNNRIKLSVLETDNININNNIIATNLDNIKIMPVLDNNLLIYSDVVVNGNLFNTKNISIEGSIIFGKSITDSVLFDSKINSDLIPKDETRNLGSNQLNWNSIFSKTIFNDNVYATETISNRIQIDNIIIDNNEIFTINNSDLTLSADGVGSILDNNSSYVVSNYVADGYTGEFSDGVGSILINNVKYFKNNTITNNAVAGVFLMANTNNGYVKFDSTFGLTVPVTDIISRPVAPEIGETFYNTEIETLEIWNGSDWTPAAGLSAIVSDEEFEDITNEMTLILG